MNWSSRPFVRIFLFVVSGIFFGRMIQHLLQPVFIYLSLAAILVFTALSFYLILKSFKWKYRLLAGYLFGSMLFLIGFLLTINHSLNEPDYVYSRASTFTAKLINQPIPTENAIKVALLASPYGDEVKNEEGQFKVIAFFEKNELSHQLVMGDKIVFEGLPAKPSKPKNPGEFDYARFLALNQIYYTVYISESRWSKLQNNSSFSLVLFANRLRNLLMQSLQENGLRGEEYAVTAAILLGYDELMDEELEKGYRNAGAMHVLCVSGLHVGIIYLVVNSMLSLLFRNRKLRFLKAFLLLLIIWLYALVTGLSPSVQRASVMLSVFVIGNVSGSARDSMNTLAASAVLMLLYDPLLILNVGFQLSYAAVLGILIFHRPIYNLIHFKNPIPDKIWSVFVLSIAAQLGTFPIAIHYFHFFPTYFWLTNLFIFPLSFLIVATGFGFLLISWVPFLSTGVGFLLAWFVKLLNLLVGFVEYLPFHGIVDIHFDWLQVVFIYVLLLFFLAVFLYAKVKYLLPLLLTICMLAGYNFINRWRGLTQNMMIVSSINKHSAIELIEGEKAIILADTGLIEDKKKFAYHLENGLITMGLDYRLHSLDTFLDHGDSTLYYDGQYGYYYGNRFAILDGTMNTFEIRAKRLEVDLIILRGKSRISLEKINRCYTYDLLVLDGSLPYYTRGKLIKECEQSGIRYVDLFAEGAFVLKL